MREEYEHQYLVFQVAEGPKVILESLNTYGKEGWELNTMITVAGDKIVAFISRKNVMVDPDPKASAKKQIDEIWTTETKEE
jgi:hypothetical protein